MGHMSLPLKRFSNTGCPLFKCFINICNQFQTIILCGHLPEIIFLLFVCYFLFIWSYFFCYVHLFCDNDMTCYWLAVGFVFFLFICHFLLPNRCHGAVRRCGQDWPPCFASTGRPPVSSLPCWKKLLLLHTYIHILFLFVIFCQMSWS